MTQLFTLKKVAARILAGLIWIGSVGIIILLLANLIGAITYTRWPTTTGQVSENNGVIHRTRQGRLWSDFTYTYQVNGKDYTNGQLWFFEQMTNPPREQFQGILAAYPPGSELLVRYNAYYPQQAVVFPTQVSPFWPGILVAVMCIIIPGFAILFGLALALWRYPMAAHDDLSA